MTDEDLLALLAHTQEAALGMATWRPLGERLRQVMGCSRVTLLVGPADGSAFIDQMASPAGTEDAERALHYRRLDPSLPVSVAVAAQRLDVKEVAFYFEVVPEREFRCSEYYADYARYTGRFHRLGFGGILGGPRMAPFALHRPESAPPFTENDRTNLLRLKPFIKHALALRERANIGALALGGRFTALDACAQAMLVLDGDQRVVHCNLAAERLLAQPEFPLRLAADGPSAGRAATTIAVRRAGDAAALQRLVRSVAIQGGPGGRQRLLFGTDDTPGVALSVLPLPARLLDGSRAPGAIPALAMMVLVDLRRKVSAGLEAGLRALFGLSPAEAAVARSVASGFTADQIAAGRGASPMTVRAQIRAVLRKVGATSLRDLERILALLPSG